MTQPNEEQLIQQSQQGAASAFEELARRYEGQVYSLAYRLTGDTAVAQDVLQETLTSAYRQIKRFRQGNFRAWLFRIAANASKDYLRSADHRRQVSLEQIVQRTDQQWSDPSESPEDYLLRRELGQVIQAGILRLPAEQRLVLVLVDLQGMDYQSAAGVAGVPAGTIKSRLSRARAAMRLHLAAHAELLPQQFRLNA